MDAYLKQLRKQSAERRAQQAEAARTSEVDREAALRERVRAWYRALPVEARPEVWFMKELARQLQATPQALGTALFELGWQRRRPYKTGQPYRNRWSPPQDWNP
jgi:hypothetical protein